MKTGRYINYQQFFSVFLLGSKSQRKKEWIPPTLDLLTPPNDTGVTHRQPTSQNKDYIFITFVHSTIGDNHFFPPNKIMFSFKLKNIYNCQIRPDHLALHPDCDGDWLQLFQGSFFPLLCNEPISSWHNKASIPSPSSSKRIYSFPVSTPKLCFQKGRAVKESDSERAPRVTMTFHDESNQRKRAPCHTRHFSICHILAQISWDKVSCLRVALRVLQPLPRGTAGIAILGS